MALLLLLIAGANVTGLMIVRAQSRRRDAAVQCALGIGGGRLFRAHLLETLLVTGAAAAGGIALASVLLPLFVALGPADLARLRDLRGVEAAQVAAAHPHPQPFEHGVVGVGGGVVLEGEPLDGPPTGRSGRRSRCSPSRPADPNFVVQSVAPLRVVVVVACALGASN